MFEQLPWGRKEERLKSPFSVARLQVVRFDARHAFEHCFSLGVAKAAGRK